MSENQSATINIAKSCEGDKCRHIGALNQSKDKLTAAIKHTIPWPAIGVIYHCRNIYFTSHIPSPSLSLNMYTLYGPLFCTS